MRFTFLRPAVMPALLLATTAAPVQAVTVAWGDWWSSEGLYGAVINRPGGAVNVSYAGATNGVVAGPCFAAVADLWATGTYNGPVNKPVCDRLVLATGGAKSIAFSEPVENPFLAVMNWDGVSVQFDAPFELISSGTGHFGTGTVELNGDSSGFSGNGPVHAVIRFNGTFSGIAFTDTDTNIPRYLTVGVGDGAVVPEPATWSLLIGGFWLIGARLRGHRALCSHPARGLPRAS